MGDAVHIQEVRPTRLGSAEMFTGAVYIDEITDRDVPSRLRVNIVRFSPGARTAWHSHARGQTLRITEGHGEYTYAAVSWSRSAPETRSTPRPASGIGTVQPPTTS